MKNGEAIGNSMDFDKILHHTGHVGRYQKLRILLLMLGPLCGGIAVTSFIFTGYVPKYRCVINECENVAATSYYEKDILPFGNWQDSDLIFSRFVHSAIGLINPSEDLDRIGKTCKRILPSNPDLASPTYNISFAETCGTLKKDINETLQNGKISNNSKEVLENITESCSTGELVYDKSIVTSSFSIDHEFVCGRYYLKGIFNALYMLGMLIGAFILGMISDHWGRRSAFFISILLVGSAGVISPFITSTIFFGLLRIVEGMGGMGCFLIPYIMIAESTLPTHVVTLTVLVSLGWPIGELILAMEAYLIRDHLTLQLVSHAPMFLVIIVILLWIPESTRWLISKKMYLKAKTQVLTIAKMNQTAVPESLLNWTIDSSRMDWSTFNEKIERTAVANDNQHPTNQKLSILDLFRPVSMMLRTFNMFLQWFSVTMVFYGLTFASATLKLAGSVYLNFTLNVLVEFGASLIAFLFIDKFGRRPFMIGTQLLSGICVLIAGHMGNIQEDSEIHQQVNVSAIQTFFYMFGKLLASLCFGMCYLYTSELYPTALRGTAVGSCSTMARIGGVIALCIAPLGKIWKPLPLTIMGSVAVVAGVFAFAFPETTGLKLPENMTDAINIGKKESTGHKVTQVQPISVANGAENEAYNEEK